MKRILLKLIVYFSSCPAFLNGVADKLFERGLCLSSMSNMTDDDHERVLNVIIKFLFRKTGQTVTRDKILR